MTLENTAAEQTRADRDASAGVPLTRAEYRRRQAAAAAERAEAASDARDAAPRDASADFSFDDLFAAASHLFAATATTPVARVEPEPVAPAREECVAASVAPRSRARRVLKRIAAGSLSLGATAAVGLLAFSAMLPTSAIATAPTADIASAASAVAQPKEIQAFVASGAAEKPLDRPETYGVVSMAELAAESGVTQFAGTWVNDPSAEVQYPFPVGVPISSGFRTVDYYNEFGSWHNGVDLTPGGGAEIHAVAAGTVRIASEGGDTYGVTIVIDHVIDGQTVSTRYGHMRYGSMRVAVGDNVAAGEVIGLVGSTGKSTGDHLHLEVLLDGTTPTDPLPWIRAHTS